MSDALTAALRVSMHSTSGLALRASSYSRLFRPGMLMQPSAASSWSSPWLRFRPADMPSSAQLAAWTGQRATAVTRTRISTAHAVVVTALFMSAWRLRHSRYRPTTPTVTAPKIVKTWL